MNLAVIFGQMGRYDEAHIANRRAVALAPGNPSCHFNLAMFFLRTGRFDQAVPVFRRAAAIAPRDAEAQNGLGNALFETGRYAEAADVFGTILALGANHPAIHFSQGNALFRLGRIDEAVASFRRAIDLKSDFVDALINLGSALKAQGRLGDALTHLRRAAALAPKSAEAQFNLGNALQDAGQLADAIDCYGKAIAVNPDMAVAYVNRGTAQQELGRLEDAEASFRQALRRDGNWSEAHFNLGNALKEQDRPDEAMACYRRALALNPDLAECHFALCAASLPILAESRDQADSAAARFAASLDELEGYGRTHMARLGRAATTRHQPFYLAYRAGNHRDVLSRFGDLTATASRAYWQDEVGLSIKAPPTRKRIRIGIVSAHIRHHPVWDVVLKGLVAHLDRERFEMVIYHLGARTDEETAWAAEQASRFIQGPLPIESWLRHIAEDCPDVLFYPELGMDALCYSLASLRLAPLQVASWGHPITTGLPTIDVFLSGELLESDDAQDHYREKLITLPGTGACTLPSPTVTDGSRRTAPFDGEALGLTTNAETVDFALCQTLYKFDPRYDGLYARIAKETGPCRFWLFKEPKHPKTIERLVRRLGRAFEAAGLDPDAHLHVMTWLSPHHFDDFLDAMDVYLDCPGFSGYTTAWQVTRRGLPIVTLEGPQTRQRLAAGLLRQIGQTEGVASSDEDYATIAIRLGRESRILDQRTARRSAIRRAAAAADGNLGVVRAFETALVDNLGHAGKK